MTRGGGLVNLLVGALTAVTTRERNRGKRALDGGVGGAHCAGECVQEGAKIVAEVGPREKKVRLGAIPEVGHDVVQSEECAGRGRTVVVPDMGVVRISAKAGGAFGDKAVFGGCGQVCFRCIDRRASFSGLVRDGCDDPGIVTSGVEETVQFADVGRAKTIVVVHDDVKGDGTEWEEGKERGQGMGGWETHFEEKHMLQYSPTR